jgi:hypothetical protein
MKTNQRRYAPITPDRHSLESMIGINRIDRPLSTEYAVGPASCGPSALSRQASDTD